MRCCRLLLIDGLYLRLAVTSPVTDASYYVCCCDCKGSSKWLIMCNLSWLLTCVVGCSYKQVSMRY